MTNHFKNIRSTAQMRTVRADTDPLTFCFCKLKSNSHLMQCFTTKHCSQQTAIVLQHPPDLTPANNHRVIHHRVTTVKQHTEQNTRSKLTHKISFHQSQTKPFSCHSCYLLCQEPEEEQTVSSEKASELTPEACQTQLPRHVPQAIMLVISDICDLLLTDITD